MLNLDGMSVWVTKDIQIIYESYINWPKNSDSIIQVSYPRSGRHWMEALIKQTILGQDGYYDLQDFDSSLKCYYFGTHVKNWPAFDENGKYIYLIRDPRDVFLSYMYYCHRLNMRLTIEQHFDNYDLLNHETKIWKRMLETFIKTDCIIIQYERLCLYPKIELKRIANFIGKKIITDIDQVMIQCDNGYYIYYNPDKPCQCMEQFFESNLARYKNHCLKWQHNPRFTKKHFDIIWGNLKSIMPYYGYLEDGHSTNLLVR